MATDDNIAQVQKLWGTNVWWTLVCHGCQNNDWAVVLDEEKLMADGFRLDQGFVTRDEPMPAKYIRALCCKGCGYRIDVNHPHTEGVLPVR